MLEAPSPALSAIRARTVLALLVVSLIALVVLPAFVLPDWTAEEKRIFSTPIFEPGADSFPIVLSIISAVVIANGSGGGRVSRLLLNRWWKKSGLHRSIAFSSVLFALMHFDILEFLIFGFVLSVLFIKTGSLYGPITVHIINNTLVLIVSALAG